MLEFLLNAILCHAAPYSARPGLRSDEHDPGTAGYYYYKRARQILWLEEDIMAKPSVVTCQGLALLASREAGCARNARGWILSGIDQSQCRNCRYVFSNGYRSRSSSGFSPSHRRRTFK